MSGPHRLFAGKPFDLEVWWWYTWSNETTIGRVVERAREERPRADRGWWKGPRTTGERTGLPPAPRPPLCHWRRTPSVGANQTHPRFLREDPLPLPTRGPPLLLLVSGRSIRIGIGRGEENFTRNVPLLLSTSRGWMNRMQLRFLPRHGTRCSFSFLLSQVFFARENAREMDFVTS